MTRKKKVSPDAVNMTLPEAMVVSSVSAAPPPKRAASPDNGDNLLTLNHILIKRIKEQSEQISHLQSRIDNVAGEHSILFFLERDVTRLVVAAGLAEASAKDGERAERDRQSVAAHKTAAEEKVKAMELALRAVGEKLQAGKVEKEGIQRALSEALSERDSALFGLAQINRELNAREESSKKQQEQLMENLRQSKNDLETLEAEKVAIEEQMRSLKEALTSTNDKLMWVDRDKSEMKIALDQAISEKTANRERLEMKENLCVQLQDQLKSVQVQADDLNKLKEAMVEEFEGNVAKVLDEKSSLKKRLEQELEAQKADFEKELNDVKNYSKKIQQEKDLVEGSRANQDNVIADLKSELLQLQLSSSEIQELSRVRDEQNAQLKSNLESAESNLLLYKAEASSLRKQIKKLIEHNEDIQGKLQNVKAELASLLVGSENKSKQYDSLLKEKSLLEEKLIDMQNMFKEMEVQNKTSRVNIEKAFNLLRSTSDAINGSVDFKESQMAEKLEEQELQSEIRQFEKILDGIKLAFKRRIEKNEDMTCDLELLQGALVEAKKKNDGTWIWFFPAATTILAAISLAYAAKGR